MKTIKGKLGINLPLEQLHELEEYSIKNNENKSNIISRAVDLLFHYTPLGDLPKKEQYRRIKTQKLDPEVAFRYWIETTRKITKSKVKKIFHHLYITEYVAPKMIQLDKEKFSDCVLVQAIDNLTQLIYPIPESLPDLITDLETRFNAETDFTLDSDHFYIMVRDPIIQSKIYRIFQLYPLTQHMLIKKVYANDDEYIQETFDYENNYFGIQINRINFPQEN